MKMKPELPTLIYFYEVHFDNIEIVVELQLLLSSSYTSQLLQCHSGEQSVYKKQAPTIVCASL